MSLFSLFIFPLFNPFIQLYTASLITPVGDKLHPVPLCPHVPSSEILPFSSFGVKLVKQLSRKLLSIKASPHWLTGQEVPVLLRGRMDEHIN